MKCADVAKEFVNDFPRLQLNALCGAVNYADKFKACEDFPKYPEVIESVYDLTCPGNMPWPEGVKQKLFGKKWKITATEIIE